MQWEYEILRICEGGYGHYPQEHPDANDYVICDDGYNNEYLNKSIQNLNRWGAKGWEIAGIYRYPNSRTGYIYLKRPKATTN